MITVSINGHHLLVRDDVYALSKIQNGLSFWYKTQNYLDNAKKLKLDNVDLDYIEHLQLERLLTEMNYCAFPNAQESLKSYRKDQKVDLDNEKTYLGY